MSEKTKIQWCDATWNPWRGCRKVSPGCEHCYITTTVPFRTSGQKHGPIRVRAEKPTLNLPFKLNKRPWVCDDCGAAVIEPSDHIKVKGYIAESVDKELKPKKVEIPDEWCLCSRFHRARIFTMSLGDFWDDENVPLEWLARDLNVIYRCENVDFLILTKRPQNWRQRIQWILNRQQASGDLDYPVEFFQWLENWLNGVPPKNVWIGVSVENQKCADERIPELLKITAVIRFLSMEPLLGPVNLEQVAPYVLCGDTSNPGYINAFNGCAYHPLTCQTNFREKSPDDIGVDWVIVGGESGHGARICNVADIRAIVQQCKAAGVPVFVKQLGSNAREYGTFVPPRPSRIDLKDKKGGDMDEWPEDLRIREFPRLPACWQGTEQAIPAKNERQFAL